MSVILTQDPNPQNSPVASNIVMLVGVTFFLFIITLFFLYFNNNQYLIELQQLADGSETGSKKMRLFSEFAELARGRSRNTLQILETEDPFEQDELNQVLESFASKFADIRMQLEEMSFSEEDRALYDSAFEWVPKVLPAQRKAVELLMFDGDRDQARHLIYDIVLPGQQHIVDIFAELVRREQHHIQKNAAEVHDSVLRINRYNNGLFGFILIVTACLSLVVIYRILRVQRHLKRAYENLEEKVEIRTSDLKEARDEALTASKAKSEFLSSMSHELRTPLNAILGFAQLLQMDPLEPSQKESVDEIYKAGKHLLELINEVLDLAKIEAGRMTLSMEEVNLANVISEVGMLTSPVAERYQIKVDYPSVFTGTVHADYTRLKQVLINLISNAIKYNKPDGTVEISEQLISTEKIRISIKDTGPGIPESLQDGLFEPFNRLGAEGSDIEGTGIGLMITRQLIDMMGGEIGFDSVWGEGTTFWIELKLLSVDQDEGVVGSKNRVWQEKVPAKISEQKTILYIEDNPANMRFMEQVFERQSDYELLTALTPSTGLDLAEGHLPNLILLDINLPEMNGYEVLRRLKENILTAQIPVIAVTANAMTDSVTRGEASAFDDYVTKPINISVLLAAVETQMNHND